MGDAKAGEEIYSKVDDILKEILASKAVKKKRITNLLDTFIENPDNTVDHIKNADGDTLLYLLARRDEENLLKWLFVRYPLTPEIVSENIVTKVGEMVNRRQIFAFLQNPNVHTLVEKRALEFVFEFADKYKKKIADYQEEIATRERQKMTKSDYASKILVPFVRLVGTVADSLGGSTSLLTEVSEPVAEGAADTAKEYFDIKRMNKMKRNVTIYKIMEAEETGVEELLVRIGYEIFSRFEQYLFDNFSMSKWQEPSTGYRALAEDCVDRILNYVAKNCDGVLTHGKVFCIEQFFFEGSSKSQFHTKWFDFFHNCKYSGIVISDATSDKVHYYRHKNTSEKFGYRKPFTRFEGQPPNNFKRLPTNPWNSYKFSLASDMMETGVSELKKRLVTASKIQVPTFSHESGTHDPITFGVRPASENFIGRSGKLKRIEDYFLESGTKNFSIFVINGFTGIGKSELAAQFVNKFKNAQGNTVWLRRKEGFESSFVDFFTTEIQKKGTLRQKQLTHEEMIKACYNVLSKRDTILVFDNAESLTEVRPFFPDPTEPANGKMFVLVTSTSTLQFFCQGLQKNPVKIESLTIDAFTKDEALTFLGKHDFDETCAGRSDIVKLIKRMDGIPLMLQQFCTYVKKVNKDSKGVLEAVCSSLDSKYDKVCLEILSTELEVGKGWPVNSAVTRWRVIFEDLQEKGDSGRVAVDLVNILSYLAYKPVDLNLKCLPGLFQTSKKTFQHAIKMLTHNFVLLTPGGNTQFSSSFVQQGNSFSKNVNNVGHYYVQSLIRKVVRAENANSTEKESKTLESVLKFVSTLIKEDVDCDQHLRSVWRYALNHDRLVTTYLLDPHYAAQFFHGLLKNNDEAVCEILEKVESIFNSTKDRAFKRRQGAMANMKSKRHQNTPLHQCLKYGNMEAFKIFLKWGAKVDERNGHGISPLHWCAQHGITQRSKVVELLLSNDVSGTILEQKSGDEEYTPLLLSLKYRHENFALMLIQKYKVLVDVQSTTGFTSLHFACQGGMLKVVEVLVSEKHKGRFQAFLKGEKLDQLKEMVVNGEGKYAKRTARNREKILSLLVTTSYD